MYNKVRANGVIYINTRFIRAAFKCGDMRRDQMINEGELVKTTLLGNTVYTSHSEVARNFPAVVQDIDLQLKDVILAYTESKIWKTYVCKAGTDIYEYQGHLLVNYRDIDYDQKYRYRERMPRVQMFSDSYVVVNAYRKKEQNPLVIQVQF